MFQLAGDSEAKAGEVNKDLQRQNEHDRVAYHQRETVLEENKRMIACRLEESSLAG
jgi:hypothetical protein